MIERLQVESVALVCSMFPLNPLSNFLQFSPQATNLSLHTPQHPPGRSSFSTKSILPVLYSAVTFTFLGFTNVHTN